jgi:HTH-type transcriptional regulator / antitoxin HipB
MAVKMPNHRSLSPNGNFTEETLGLPCLVRTASQLGALAREQRKRQHLKQLDVAGLGNTGNRFIVELERGKPTVQLQKVLDVLDLLGLEVVVQAKTGSAR